MLASSGASELTAELEERLRVLSSNEYQASDAYREDPRVMRAAVGYLALGIVISVITLIAW